MTKILFFLLFFSLSFCSFPQNQFSGFIRDSKGKAIKQCRVTALFGSKYERTSTTNDAGYFYFETNSKQIGVYDSFELYINLKDKYSIVSTDFDDIVNISRETNRIDISLAARARNVKKTLNITVSSLEELSNEPIYFKIQLRATPEPIKKETLDYLERKLKDLKVEIVEESSESGIFKYRYYVDKSFQTRIKANEFINKLKLYKMKGFVVPFYK